MARDDGQTNVRLPRELKKWLLERAGENRRSLTGELVVLLEKARKADTEKPQKGDAGNRANGSGIE
jgi:hypothetical protein